MDPRSVRVVGVAANTVSQSETRGQQKIIISTYTFFLLFKCRILSQNEARVRQLGRKEKINDREKKGPKKLE